MPCIVAWTSAASSVPETEPPFGPGQTGVPAGPGLLAVPQSQSTMLPLIAGRPKWMCACVTLPWSPVVLERVADRLLVRGDVQHEGPHRSEWSHSAMRGQAE